MHARDRGRRAGGTALLAAFAITGLLAVLAGFGASDSASKRIVERTVTRSTVQEFDNGLRPLSLASIAYSSEIPRPPDPPPAIVIEQWWKESPRLSPPLKQSSTVANPAKAREHAH